MPSPRDPLSAMTRPTPGEGCEGCGSCSQAFCGPRNGGAYPGHAPPSLHALPVRIGDEAAGHASRDHAGGHSSPGMFCDCLTMCTVHAQTCSVRLQTETPEFSATQPALRAGAQKMCSPAKSSPPGAKNTACVFACVQTDLSRDESTPCSTFYPLDYAA